MLSGQKLQARQRLGLIPQATLPRKLRRWISALVMPRLHQRNMLRSNKLRGRATCCGQQATCCGQQVACCRQQVACCAQHVASSNMLRGSCADEQVVAGNKQHVAGNKLLVARNMLLQATCCA